MSSNLITRLARSDSGAVAPTIGISLFALIAAGGLAFDYSRMATMDTELQNAADQAALAAATQLDGKTNARSRATSAAQTLVSNLTLMANDDVGTRVISVPTVTFYVDKPRTNVATTDAEANFVLVTVGTREAFFALTPIVAALSSGQLAASAYAGLGSALCKVPPVMICNPEETATNTDFNGNALIGKGLRLVSVGSTGGWAPGNFGYLDTHGLSNGAPGLREALGWSPPPGDCQPESGVDTKPGATVSVTDALNTRFDVYDGNASCPSGGDCPPARNTVKDLIRPAPSGNGNGGNACALHNSGWQESSRPYLPTSATTPLTATELLPANRPLSMGHPRDMCHAVSQTGACSGAHIGDGLWDRNAYFTVNYPSLTNWQSVIDAYLTSAGATGYSNSNVTRYQVYNWEMANAATTIDVARTASGSGNNALNAYGAPICSPPGVTPGPTSVDRRRLSVAVVNCLEEDVNGNSTALPVKDWLEVFLVEPSVSRTRTHQGDIYVEVIGVTSSGTAGATTGQVVRRDVPYLIE